MDEPKQVGGPSKAPAGENPVTILEELAEYCRSAGEFSSAIEYYHQILGLAERASRSSGILATTCRKLAACLLAEGNPQGALEVLERSEAFESAEADPAERGAALSLRAHALFALGRADGAEPTAREALATLRGGPAIGPLAVGHRVLGEILRDRGELGDARLHLDAARALAAEAEDEAELRAAWLASGRLECAAGRLGAGLDAFEAAAAGAEPHPQRARARAATAQIRLWQGRFAEARGAAADALAEPSDPETRALAEIVDGLARRAQSDPFEGQPHDARALGESARDGGPRVQAALAEMHWLESLRRVAQAGGEGTLPQPRPADGPLGAAVSAALTALARMEEDFSAPIRGEFLAALATLRRAEAHDPLIALLIVSAVRLGPRDPAWSDGALAEALRLLREQGRSADLFRGILVRAKLALARDSFSDALRALESASQLARDEGLAEDTSPLRAMREAVDSALARGGGGHLDSLTDFDQLIRSLRLLEDPTVALRQLVEAAPGWVGGESALLLLEGDADARGWVPFHCAGIPDAESEAVGLTARRVARVVADERGQPLASSRPSDDRRLVEPGEPAPPLGALIAAPLIGEGRVAGVLIVMRRAAAEPFPRAALSFLAALSTFAASIDSDRKREAIRRENLRLKHRLGLEGGFEAILTQNVRMLKIVETLKRVAGGSATVLLQGETGTGKELIARAIHQHGIEERGGSFVTVSCAELTEQILESELFGHTKGAFTGAVEEKKGLFEIADGGTVFLDEIDKTSRGFQETLLRVVDQREIKPVGATRSQQIDLRIVCASNVELKRAVEEGRFLKDLYYRLRVISITLPPLRERTEDVPLLAEHFLRLASERLGRSVAGFSPEAMKRLVAHSWPGNVRDLENEIERLVALTSEGDEIAAGSLSAEVGGVGLGSAVSGAAQKPLAEILEEVERNLVLNALLCCQGNRSKAARRLGVSRRGLLNKVERFGLSDVGRSAEETP